METNEKNDLLSFAQKVGEKGFLLPSEVSVQDFLVALHKTYQYCQDGYSVSIFQVVKIFFDNLSNHKMIQYGEIVKKRLLSYVDINEVLVQRIKETIYAYDYCLFFPCICAGFSIVETIITNNNLTEKTNQKVLFEEMIALKKQPKSIECDLQIANLRGFLSGVTCRYCFTAEEPELINRHWILHGRSEKAIDKIDCLYILFLIDSLISLQGFLSNKT